MCVCVCVHVYVYSVAYCLPLSCMVATPLPALTATWHLLPDKFKVGAGAPKNIIKAGGSENVYLDVHTPWWLAITSPTGLSNLPSKPPLPVVSQQDL